MELVSLKDCDPLQGPGAMTARVTSADIAALTEDSGEEIAKDAHTLLKWWRLPEVCAEKAKSRGRLEAAASPQTAKYRRVAR